jgi:hypothetical protein
MCIAVSTATFEEPYTKYMSIAMSSSISESTSVPHVAFIAVILIVALICLVFAFSIFWNRFARSKRVPDLENASGSWKSSKGLLATQRKDSLPFPAPPPYPGHGLTAMLAPPPAYLTSDSKNIQTHSLQNSTSTDPHHDWLPSSSEDAVLLFVVPSEVPLYSSTPSASPTLYSPNRSSFAAQQTATSEGSGAERIAVPNPAGC